MSNEELSAMYDELGKGIRSLCELVEGVELVALTIKQNAPQSLHSETTIFLRLSEKMLGFLHNYLEMKGKCKNDNRRENCKIT